MKHFDSFDDDYEFQSNEINEYQIKFESMIEKNEFSFMDADELDNLYQFYWIHSKKELCEELLQFAIEIHPHNPTFYEYQFNHLISAEKYREALDWIEQTISIFPHNMPILLLKGKALMKLNEYHQAIEWYLSILDFNTYLAEIYFALGKCYHKIHNKEKCFLYFLLAFQEKNEDINSLIYSYSFSYFDYSLAVEFLNKIIDKDPFHSESWYYLSLTYFYNKNLENALKAIDYAIALQDEHIDYYLQKVEFYISNEYFEEAIQVLFEALAIDNQNETVYFYLGVCYQHLEQFDEGRKYFKKCIDLDDSYFDAYDGLADCLYELERYQEALYYYKVYLDNTVNIEVSLKYVDLEIELENFGQALIYMQELENLFQDEYLEVELILRRTYIEFLKQNEFINHILRENFYNNYQDDDNSSKLMFQSAALSFELGARNIGLFYLENALLKCPQNYEYLYDYNPDLSEDIEIQLIIESYLKKS